LWDPIGVSSVKVKGELDEFFDIPFTSEIKFSDIHNGLPYKYATAELYLEEEVQLYLIFGKEFVHRKKPTAIEPGPAWVMIAGGR